MTARRKTFHDYVAPPEAKKEKKRKRKKNADRHGGCGGQTRATLRYADGEARAARAGSVNSQ